MFLCRSMCCLLSGRPSFGMRLLLHSVVLSVAVLPFSGSVSDAHVGCRSPSRLRMQCAVVCSGLSMCVGRCDVPVPVDVSLAFGVAVVCYAVASALYCYGRCFACVPGFGFRCSCGLLLAQPPSYALCCVLPRSVYSPHARHTHTPHTPHRLHTHHTLPHTSYTPYTASTPHHVHSSHTFIHHPSPMLAYTQIWDGMLLVTYLGYTSVFDQIQQTYPMLYNALRCLTKFNKSIQPS